MRKLLIILCVSLAACACLAGSGYQSRISMGTNTATSAAFPHTIRGAVDTVYAGAFTNDAITAVTGTVWVTYAPHYGAGSETIVSNAVTGSATFRPRVTGHNISGVALAAATNTPPATNIVTTVLSAPYEPIRLSGETVTARIIGSATNVQWRIVIVTD